MVPREKTSSEYGSYQFLWHRYVAYVTCTVSNCKAKLVVKSDHELYDNDKCAPNSSYILRNGPQRYEYGMRMTDAKSDAIYSTCNAMLFIGDLLLLP